LIGKQIVHAASASNLIGTFRKPDSAGSMRGLREWAAMLFWCQHCQADDDWDDSICNEQSYIINCFVTPEVVQKSAQNLRQEHDYDLVAESEAHQGPIRRQESVRFATSRSPFGSHGGPRFVDAGGEGAREGNFADQAPIAWNQRLDQNPGESLSQQELKELSTANRVHKMGALGGTKVTKQLPYANLLTSSPSYGHRRSW
jgi:hypothetical protein